MDVTAFDPGSVMTLLQSLRAGAGLTQAELAERIGTTQSAVSRWERGHDEPRLSSIRVIAAACGHQITMHVEPDGVDRAQIQQQLAMTPEQRLASVVNVSQALASARRVG